MDRFVDAKERDVELVGAEFLRCFRSLAGGGLEDVIENVIEDLRGDILEVADVIPTSPRRGCTHLEQLVDCGFEVGQGELLWSKFCFPGGLGSLCSTA
jgi:hypothetical protein